MLDTEDHITEIVRRRHRPEKMSERIALACYKLSGDVPLGIDAPNKGLRKIIGGILELMFVANSCFCTIISFVFSLLFLWVGVGSVHFKAMACGVVFLIMSVISYKKTRKAVGTLYSILKA